MTDAEPVLVDGTTVQLDHRAFRQVCVARPDGVKQDFVFSSLPEGDGDLVVALRWSSPIAGNVTDDGGVAFVDPDHGGVTVGSVVGIDADGERCAGSIALNGELLEFRLPAAFVDGARLPIELDPLVGGQVRVGAGGAGALQPDMAYDASNDVFALVYVRAVSTTDADAYGQRMDASGQPLGPPIALDLDPAWAPWYPHIANINNRDAFVVVFSNLNRTSWQTQVHGVAMAAGTNTAGPRTLLSRATDTIPRDCDVGGEMPLTVSHNDAVAVFVDVWTGKLWGLQIDVSTSLVLSPFGYRLLTTGTIDHPSISKSGGPDGRLLIVWQQERGSDIDLRGMVVSRDMGPFTSHATIVQTSGRQFTFPDVDGDGERWVVVYNRRLTSGGHVSTQANSVTWRPGMSLPVAGTAIWVKGTDATRDAERPSVAWTGGTCLIGYSLDYAGSASGEAWVKSVDLFDCATCEDEVRLAATSRGLVTAVASKLAGGGTTRDCLVVRSEFDQPDQVWSRRWRSDDGIATDLGGGCYGGARIWAQCARGGSPEFEMRVTAAVPTAASWLVLSLDRLRFSCSGCELIADPFSGYVLPATTDGRGDAAIPTGITDSSATGLQFYAQWLFAVPSGSAPCASFPVGMSNAVRVQIQ